MGSVTDQQNTSECDVIIVGAGPAVILPGPHLIVMFVAYLYRD